MRFKEIIEKHLLAALEACGYPHGKERLVLERPRMKEHGDIAAPVALSLARVLKKNPFEIAERIASELSCLVEEHGAIPVEVDEHHRHWLPLCMVRDVLVMVSLLAVGCECPLDQ